MTSEEIVAKQPILEEEKDISFNDDPMCCITRTKRIEYKCCVIGVLPFFYISDCIRIGFCQTK